MYPKLITAWAEHCSGPGWSNDVLWVLVETAHGKLEVVGLPVGILPIAASLVDISACVSAAIAQSARDAVKERPELLS